MVGVERPETPRSLFEQLFKDAVYVEPVFPDTPNPDVVDKVFALADIGPDEQERLRGIYKEQHLRQPAMLLESLLLSEQEDVRARLLDPEQLLAAELHLADLNAQALRAGNGGWLIVINSGLIAFVYKTIRALSRHFVAEGRRSQGRVELEPTADLIATVFDWYVETGIPFGPDFPVTWEQMQLASLLATESERFVIAHELAHHLLGHLEDGTRQLLAATVDVPVHEPSREHELDADALGLTLALESQLRSTDAPMAVARTYAGIELFFHAVDFLEQSAGAPDDSTHPPAGERLANVRELVDGVARDYGLPIFRISPAVDQLVTQIRPHVLEYATLSPTDVEHEDGVKLLADLVAAHARTTPPDYLGFLSTILEHLYDHRSAVWCDAIAERMTSLRASLAAGDPNGLTEFKLLASLITNHPPLLWGVQDRLDWQLPPVS